MYYVFVVRRVINPNETAAKSKRVKKNYQSKQIVDTTFFVLTSLQRTRAITEITPEQWTYPTFRLNARRFYHHYYYY